MSVAALGSTYSAKGCTAASTMALDELESKVTVSPAFGAEGEKVN